MTVCRKEKHTSYVLKDNLEHGVNSSTLSLMSTENKITIIWLV
ncbi:unnamed protein product [Brassica oleracea]